MSAYEFPEDEPGWTCCGEPGCQFAKKCADVERLDRAFRAEQCPKEARCHDVSFDSEVPADRDRRDYEPGDLAWEPKMGQGHVIIGSKRCDGGEFYCGYCGGMMTSESGFCEGEWPQCECGKFNAGDHHNFMLAKAAP